MNSANGMMSPSMLAWVDVHKEEVSKDGTIVVLLLVFIVVLLLVFAEEITALFVLNQIYMRIFDEFYTFGIHFIPQLFVSDLFILYTYLQYF